MVHIAQSAEESLRVDIAQSAEESLRVDIAQSAEDVFGRYCTVSWRCSQGTGCRRQLKG